MRRPLARVHMHCSEIQVGVDVISRPLLLVADDYDLPGGRGPASGDRDVTWLAGDRAGHRVCEGDVRVMARDERPDGDAGADYADDADEKGDEAAQWTPPWRARFSVGFGPRDLALGAGSRVPRVMPRVGSSRLLPGWGGVRAVFFICVLI